MASKTRAKPLPQLFQRLTAADWQHARTWSASVGRGQHRAFRTSAGYIDLGRSIGGAVYLGAHSYDASGAGAHEYRRVFQMAWPS